MKTSYEYIVLGLGGIGSAALYWLAREAGEDVLGLEQFEIGHVRGGSQDHSRIIRLSYHTPDYVALAKGAYQAWETLEEEAGETLIVKTGGLDFTHPKASIPISDYTNSMDAAGVPYESLSADEIMSRWPQFRLTDEISALYQAQSGIAPAAKCMAAHLRMARAYGATLRDNVPVRAIREKGNEIEVLAGETTYRCRKLVIAAGAWSNHLLAHLGLQLPLTITQEQVTYYASPHSADFMPDRFPIWIWMDEPCFYGFPVYGENGPKVAQDVGGDPVTAETRTFEPNPAIQERVDHFVKQYLPTAFGPPIYTKTCLYTMPPDRDFVLSTLPTHPNVTVAIGGGHVFKFTSVVGKILTQLSIHNHTTYHIDPFRIDRPILLQQNPTTHFMT
ncbi:MAG: N-methyl-L-tryptophan oxidase [Ardenticatenaceae bacterium]